MTRKACLLVCHALILLTFNGAFAKAKAEVTFNQEGWTDTVHNDGRLVVRYPNTIREESTHHYETDLLDFVLRKSGVPYVLKPVSASINQARIIAMLKEHQLLDVYWMGTSKQLESQLVAIPYPLYRGLLGFRAFIIHEEMQSVFAGVSTLEQLQRFRGAQGIGWSDIAILENAGLSQLTTAYENIFRMVAARRVDYFSRGITEVYAEVETYRKTYPVLTTEAHITLIYPFAMFFFVNEENTELATALNKGFEQAYADGSFHRFFYEYPAIKAALEESQLDQRRRILIANPLMSAETLAIPNARWHGRE